MKRELSDYLDEVQGCLSSILIDVDENNVTSRTMDEMTELEVWMKKSKEALIENLTPSTPSSFIPLR